MRSWKSSEGRGVRVDEVLDRSRMVEVRQHEQHVVREDPGLASRDDDLTGSVRLTEGRPAVGLFLRRRPSRPSPERPSR